MRDLIQVAITGVVLMALVLAIFAYLIGPMAFTIGLAVIGLFISHSTCAVAGAWWTERTLKSGAGIAITSTTRDNAADVEKIKAIAGLAEATVKGYATTQNSLLKVPAYPQLADPANNALRFEDGIFEELEG